MKSFIKYYNEIKPLYQNKLDLTKKFQEIPSLFSESVSKLLENIYGEDNLDRKLIESYIEFDPDKEPYFKLKKELMNFLVEDWTDSDLPSILEKMAKAAYARYKHIIEDHDRTETFRME
ncbi:conserved hypothetical protein [Petrotoga mobilis SJ95]|uniref:Uncharacterized protein n=1 Tax=Petrotoga mobilis (strain DSM 10674 / SJ95) TaxID=403833 RepID=A9BF78_PETMO|nr:MULTISPECIES: hypothetical protein [Petrotoga]ABX31142.1 conserved hypothetical protein [Petrotoga mobilis SJ95]MBL5980977.1 hypothetical protein [Petrotoga sp. 8T1HF07.NaAc.6.1]PNR94292.1 hypothetical protein X926_00620 [Petrotoga sp. HWHPT.55.6.3]RLL83865.1 hypothetical protein BZ25_05520 [Petrotoga sp. Shatin.DS.tank11.9.2.9.3]RLL90242.1 hypothetical protein CN13_02180 [Petrotoga sp. HKA.pet.4.5]